MTEPTEEKENSQNTSCYKVVDIITNALCAILLKVAQKLVILVNFL